MHKSNEDCFYFLTSSCAKGLSCTYRHSPLALTCNVICQSWIRGNCLDPACPFRHSTTIQRPMVNNGILCFYENTPTGCLKAECTFIHSRPRTNLRNTSIIRPVLTNPIKNDVPIPVGNNTPSPAVIPETKQVPEPNLNASQSIKKETAIIAPTGIPLNSETSSPVTKTETIARRIAVPSDTQPSNEKKDLSENNSSPTKCSTRSIITDSPKINSEETTTTQARLVVNRNVVLGESRTIVQTVPSSNRVVVSSNSINSSSKGKKNDIDSIEEKTEAKKFKADSQSNIDIPFPCSTSSITNRLLISSKEETTTTTTKDTKSIRLNRIRLPATKSSSGNSSLPVSTPSNEQKISAGTGLSQENDRRTMRLERFQKNPMSPTRSITCSSSITTTNSNVTINSSTIRDIITSSSNERKRTAPETTMKDVPSSKRVSRSSSSSQHQSSPRQAISSPDVFNNSSSSILNKNCEKQADKFISQNAQQKKSPKLTNSTPPQPVLSSPERPRFIPQLITAPSLNQPSSSLPTTNSPRLRQPPSVVIKRPLVSVVTTPSPTSRKSIEQVSSNTSETKTLLPPSSKSIIEYQSFNISNEEDENQLLELNDSADVVDTFALIDEALLEADHLLELM